MAVTRDSASWLAREGNLHEGWAARARVQSRLFEMVVWFGLCGVMLGGLLGTEKFLLQQLSCGAVTTLSVTLCSLGICCATGGSVTAIRLLLHLDRHGSGGSGLEK